MPKVIRYTKGSIPYFEGDAADKVFILQNGLAVLKSTDTETGTVQIDQVKPGEFFGVKSALGHFPREETVSILDDSVVVSLSIPEFEKLFSENKQLVMKMLRVFSNKLRQIHKKTEAILNKIPEDQQNGMINVAKSFYEDESYRSCCDVCKKFLTRFPSSEYASSVARLYQESNLRLQKIKKMNSGFDEPFPCPQEEEFKQFALPTFERFAKTYEAGEVIISEFEPGDTFYLIQKGEVQLLKCVNGSSKNIDILKPGEFFGEMAILDNSPRSATCMAKTSVKCLEFSKENFEILITGNSQLALGLLKLFCKRIYDQKRRFRILCMKDLYIRLCDVFLLLDEMNPPLNPVDRMRKFNVSLQDIAHWAGLSVETTRDELNKLVEKRRIEIHDSYILVLNIAEFKRVVESRFCSVNK